MNNKGGKDSVRKEEQKWMNVMQLNDWTREGVKISEWSMQGTDKVCRDYYSEGEEKGQVHEMDGM